jgi:hypothetical protein
VADLNLSLSQETRSVFRSTRAQQIATGEIAKMSALGEWGVRSIDAPENRNVVGLRRPTS